jgi:hypothetical protein
MLKREPARCSLDPRAAPPKELREVYKRYQKLPVEHLILDDDVLDFGNAVAEEPIFRQEPLDVANGLAVEAAEPSTVKSIGLSQNATPQPHFHEHDVGGLSGKLVRKHPPI